MRLAQLGRRIEAHFGLPQDIEWCLEGEDFQIVQSRPITTLFPIPDAGDGENHVYVSVGHQQMMGAAGWRAHRDRDRPGRRRRADRPQPDRDRDLETRHRDPARTGSFDFIQADIKETKRINFESKSLQVVMAGMEAAWWLNDQLVAWLGEKNAADTLSQSVASNVTSEMGLALLDVADVIRPYPEVVAFLQDTSRTRASWTSCPGIAGGREARDAIRAWLDRYGMRCVGEIDITRPRWSERPTTLLPLILGNVKNFEPGAAARRFEQGRQEARNKERGAAGALAGLAGRGAEGRRDQAEDRPGPDVRRVPGVSEIRHGQPLLRLQAGLAGRSRSPGGGPACCASGRTSSTSGSTELREVVRTHQVDERLIRRRKEAFRSYQTLTPPRVLTSDGEAVAGSYRRADLPEGALVGLAVSAGTVEGRARVVLDLAEADLEAGDILVTTYTDPSWTPLFVAIKGLVTEVGGLMTHGAVIAREYGLPAVVGVENATRRIRDGQRIRVHGTDGYVEILAEPEPSALDVVGEKG